MMKILFYEMRKSHLKTAAFILLIIFTVLNFIRMNDQCRTRFTMTYGEHGTYYFRLYDTICGELTEEKLTPFRERANELENEVMDMVFSTEYRPGEFYTGYIFGDFMLYNVDIGRAITYCSTYPNISNAIAARAAESYEFYKSVGNIYEAKTNDLIFDLYRDRYIPEFRATYWTKLFFGHEFSSLLCVIMLIFGLAASFTTEKESGMYQLIASTGNKVKASAAKLGSSAVYCAFLSVWFTGCDLIFTNALLGVKGLDMPLYSAGMFEKTPFNFSFIGAVFVVLGTRFLALFTVSLMILLISKITPNTIISIACSFGTVLVLILLTAVSQSIWNPIGMLTPNAYLTDFSCVNLFGEPVLTLFAALIALFIECGVLGAIIICSAKNRVRRSGEVKR